jgi:3-phosphoshikimate 1-carboxyvinyltransferase
MQLLEISPVKKPLHATVSVPGSKSQTNRALLVAALAEGITTIENALFSDDTKYLAYALQTLGFKISLDQTNSEMTILGLGGKIPKKEANLYIGNSGTAARFLTAFLTLGHGEYYLRGDNRMRERPIGDLIKALIMLGAKIEALDIQESEVYPPIKIIASGLLGGKTQISGNLSSQFLSALLMIAPYTQSLVEIDVNTNLRSKPYVDMTLAIMRDFGINIERDGFNIFSVSPGQYCPHSSYKIETDASAASYYFSVPAICGGTITVKNISTESIQGDIAFLSVLKQMGCTIKKTEDNIQVTGKSELCGVTVDMRDMPDVAQTLSVIAPFASTPTQIRGISSARIKETDRIAATCKELKRLGVKVEEYNDGLTIFPCKNIKPTTIRTYNDHRMAMAFSLIGLRVKGISIENPSCVSKSFPHFFEILDSIQ